MTSTQLYLTAAFSLLIIGAMLASFCVWIGVFSNFRSILDWSGWERDNHTSRIGLVDLIACFFCIVLAQGLVLYTLEAVTGQDLFKPGKARPPVGAPNDPVRAPSDAVAPGPASLTAFLSNVEQDFQGEIEKPRVAVVDSVSTASDVGSEFDNEASQVDSGKPVAAEKGDATETPSWLTPYLTLALLLGALLSILVLLLRTRASPVQLGLVNRELFRDLWIGALVFLLVTPLVMVVASVVNKLLGVEYQHPVVDAMKENPYMLPSLFFGAVVCAPIWEEYAFRGLLIGWFDSLRQSGGNPLKIFLGAGNRVADREEVSAYAPWWPAILSGIFFGGAHFGYGVSWVPLMVLGIVLGRLYQVRRSIVPCVVVHGLFNSLSMLGLAVEVLVRKG